MSTMSRNSRSRIFSRSFAADQTTENAAFIGPTPFTSSSKNCSCRPSSGSDKATSVMKPGYLVLDQGPSKQPGPRQRRPPPDGGGERGHEEVVDQHDPPGDMDRHAVGARQMHELHVAPQDDPGPHLTVQVTQPT